MMMSIICMLLVVGERSASSSAPGRQCSPSVVYESESATTSFPGLSDAYLPPGGYFFEMEAAAPI
jgi:hypothetical protein